VSTEEDQKIQEPEARESVEAAPEEEARPAPEDMAAEEAPAGEAPPEKAPPEKAPPEEAPPGEAPQATPRTREADPQRGRARPAPPAEERAERGRPARPVPPVEDQPDTTPAPVDDTEMAEEPSPTTPEPGPDAAEVVEKAPRAEVTEAAEVAEVPQTEPERQAETQVREATREVERELDERKTRIRSRDEAQAVIEDIIGAQSRISQAEVLREERVRPRMEVAERRRGAARAPEVLPEQRVEAVDYFQQRLRGEMIEGPPPVLLRRSETYTETTRTEIIEERREGRPFPRGARPDIHEERVDVYRPRYLNEGRRYVHFDSRASIPAILMAAQAMNYVNFQPVSEVAPIFYEQPEFRGPQAMPLPPENFRDENALVMSYPVDEASMITSDDILFQQGSTQFADPYSYEIVSALSEAMKALPDEERFVIEGHASAEGSYEGNMALSQQRAEKIVREMVRRGVSPYRLLPVGYGESEARHPANAAEALRRQDRRVVVFRLRDEPVASR